ncbi:MAG TPA: carboxypeptidase-like regulatory domain-containing protein [Chitinophagaceae bacterium]
MRLKFFCSLCFVFLALSSFGQSVRLNGKVINSKNEPVAGATITVMGLERSFAADVEGRFSLTLDAGKKYNLIVSSAGYDSKNLEDVELKTSEENNITIVLETKANLSEVVVRTSVRRESTSAIINLQRNNTAVSSGLAADFIRRTPDKNTGEVLKRVSGASIQDNKFVIIRGLSDRYNAAFINNTQLPSSEPDRKSFSFDVIPANMIDNIVINKTATPELTGEFAGGLVQVQTKDIPSRNFLSIGAQFGFNTQSVFKDFTSNPRSKTDWIGFDDGARNFPSGFPKSAQQYRSLGATVEGQDQQLAYSRLFSNDNYRRVTSTVAPIQTYNLSFGNVKRFKNGASFGTVFSTIYRNSKLVYDVERSFFEKDKTPIFTFTDIQNRYQTNVGALLNLTYAHKNHKVSFKNIFNRFFEDNYFTRTGVNTNRLQNVNLSSSILNQRTFYSGQLEGDHQLRLAKMKFRWNAGYSLVTRDQPDMRTSLYVQPLSGGEFEMDPDDTRRFFSSLEDHSVSAAGTLSIPFKMFGETQTFKIGGSTLLRFRDFKSRIFRYTPFSNNTFNTSLAYLPVDKIFSPENISRSGFVLDEFTNNEDKYFGISALNSGFLMFDNKLSDVLRIVWGARVEFFEQFLKTKDRSAKNVVINPETWDVLPSLNLTWSVTEKNNVRVGLYQTVARPEFREIAPFAFFDYEQNYGISGRPDLKRTKIYNADIRYEIYPGAGEAITLGAFFKRFSHPIEFRLDPGSNADRRLYFYQNARNANTYGVELEMRKNLSFLDNTNPLLDNMSFFGNFTYIFSDVTFADELSGAPVSANRPIQGQSPYLINAGLQYTSSQSGFNASLLYNRIGQRLALVGNTDFPDIYERPRHLLDIQFAKRIINKKGEIKLQLSDILNQAVYLYENVDAKKAFSKGSDRLFSSYKPGSTISVGFSYDF